MSPPCRSCIAGDVLCAERFKSDVRPMSAGKKRVSTGGTQRGMGSSAYVWIAEITPGTHLRCSRGSQQPAKTGPASLAARVPEHEGRAHAFVERRGQGNAGLRSGRRYAGGVTPQPGKGTLGHGGRGKCVHAFRTLSRAYVWAHVPSSETNRRGDGWMLVRTLACARTGRSAGTVMVANRSLGNPTDRDDNGGLRNRLCYGAIGPYRACAPQFYPNKDVIRCEQTGDGLYRNGKR
jgi:hypothetical protein